MFDLLDISGSLVLAIFLLGFLLTLLWLILPFAIFGIKGRMDKGLQQLAVMNNTLEEIRQKLDALQDANAEKGGQPGE